MVPSRGRRPRSLDRHLCIAGALDVHGKKVPALCDDVRRARSLGVAAEGLEPRSVPVEGEHAPFESDQRGGVDRLVSRGSARVGDVPPALQPERDRGHAARAPLQSNGARDD